MDWGKLFLTAEGRIGRQTFWIGFLILLGAGVVLGWIPILGALVSIALIYPWVCLYAKRFHDMGKSGWLAALPVAAPVVLMIVAVMLGIGGVLSAGLAEGGEPSPGAVFASLGVAFVFLGLALIVGLGATLWAGLSESDPGPNRYGEPPSLPVAGVGAPGHRTGV